MYCLGIVNLVPRALSLPPSKKEGREEREDPGTEVGGLYFQFLSNSVNMKKYF